MKDDFPQFAAPEDIRLYLDAHAMKAKDTQALIRYLIQSGFDLEQLNLPGDPELYWLYFMANVQKRKDYREQLEFIEAHADFLNSWYSVDSLTKYLKKLPFDPVFMKSKEYLKSENPFLRRFAYVIFMFSGTIREDTLERLFSLFQEDESYFVQMAEAWLICEIFCHFPDETYQFMRCSSLSYSIMGKAIQKIQDSYRVSEEDKRRTKALRAQYKENGRVIRG